MTEKDYGYRIEHRNVGAYHVLTSPDLYGLYCASKSEKSARDMLPESIAALEGWGGLT